MLLQTADIYIVFFSLLVNLMESIGPTTTAKKDITSSKNFSEVATCLQMPILYIAMLNKIICRMPIIVISDSNIFGVRGLTYLQP